MLMRVLAGTLGVAFFTWLTAGCSGSNGATDTDAAGGGRKGGATTCDAAGSTSCTGGDIGCDADRTCHGQACADAGDGGTASARESGAKDAAGDALSCPEPADAATPPSCAAGGSGASACGPCEESCCASEEVVGGTFYRTDGTAYPATVADLLLDKYEVTVARFRAFVTAWDGGTGYMPPSGSGKHTYLNGGSGLVSAYAASDGGVAYEQGWLAAYDAFVDPTDENLTSCIGTPTWSPTPGDTDAMPIGCINWYEAYAFCIWDGGFLPSEAEWEYAAVGGSAERPFPWGKTPPGLSNRYAVYDCSYPGGADAGCSVAPVGTTTPSAPECGASSIWWAT
jgi:sulfatase-modifying factor enzyme 1